MDISATHYFQRHWRGQQSLWWSFWVNLVGVRLALFMLQNTMVPGEGRDHHDERLLVFTLVVIFHAVLLVWQIVGVVRAAETHYSQRGNMALVWGAQLGAVLMFVMSAVYALGAIQMTFKTPQDANVLKKMDEEHASLYSLDVSEDGRVLFVTGSLELGITRAATRMVAEHVSLQLAVLDSPGGNIYEGRGLARLFATNSLHTHVSASCASACTIAFAGGESRSASPDATFGFHQYRVDASYTIIVTDVKKEQERDQQLLLDAGIDNGFVKTVFTHPSGSMWWPEMQRLKDADFVHQITSLTAQSYPSPP